MNVQESDEEAAAAAQQATIEPGIQQKDLANTLVEMLIEKEPLIAPVMPVIRIEQGSVQQAPTEPLGGASGNQEAAALASQTGVVKRSIEQETPASSPTEVLDIQETAAPVSQIVFMEKSAKQNIEQKIGQNIEQSIDQGAKPINEQQVSHVSLVDTPGIPETRASASKYNVTEQNTKLNVGEQGDLSQSLVENASTHDATPVASQKDAIDQSPEQEDPTRSPVESPVITPSRTLRSLKAVNYAGTDYSPAEAEQHFRLGEDGLKHAGSAKNQKKRSRSSEDVGPSKKKSKIVTLSVRFPTSIISNDKVDAVNTSPDSTDSELAGRMSPSDDSGLFHPTISSSPLSSPISSPEPSDTEEAPKLQNRTVRKATTAQSARRAQKAVKGNTSRRKPLATKASAPKGYSSKTKPSAPKTKLPASKTKAPSVKAGAEAQGSENAKGTGKAKAGTDASTEAAIAAASRRPPPVRAPPATASSRAALAETLPYYRAHQSAAYTGHGPVTGFYLSESVMKRPHFDSDVVITRSGGHHGKTTDGQMKQTSNVTEDDAQVKAFFRNKLNKTPFVLIVGDANQNCPVTVPEAFNLMAWFQVTDIWAEVNEGYKTYLYRLERIRRPGNEAWWVASEDEMSPVPTGVVCHKQSCQRCGQISKQVYLRGWMCLQPGCSGFWKFKGSRKAEDKQLVYNPDFLKERSEFPEAITFPFDMIPPEPSLTAEEAASGGALSRKMWKGMLCKVCRHVSFRRNFYFHQCDRCKRILDLPMPVLSMGQIRDPHALLATGVPLFADEYNAGLVDYSWWIQGHYVFRKFDLGGDNVVLHVQSNEPLNQAPGGADDMLRALQVDRSIDLQRRPMQGRNGKAESLVCHFSANFGFPYKYVVAQKSRPFSEAPEVILQALERCQWVAEQAVGKGQFDRFNEVLAVGYMEGGKMGYHDDGEKELGDTVVAMCIGGNATMRVRMKDGHFRGIGRKAESKAVDHHARVPPGALFQEERKMLNAKFADQAYNDKVKNELTAAMRKVHTNYALGLDEKGRRRKIPLECPDLVTLKFKHGDFFMMKGPDIQQLYEHGVMVDDKLRFALTCRHVTFDNLEADVKEDIIARKLGDYDMSKFKYDGELDGNPALRGRSETFVPSRD